MNKYFIACEDGRPAAMLINGHRLVIISSDPGDLEDHMERIGGTILAELGDLDVPDEEDPRLLELASSVDAGVVVAPDDLDVSELIRNLEDELPWIQ
ncbi:MAG: hypothetical protein KDD55_11305 [Bdellovibrionales bacterium]|nr:hypothetical protein [Bdellovibrionales bacterium]